MLTEEPLMPDDAEITGAGEDLFFSTEFPSLVSTPLIDQDEMVADPVTSGTDNAAGSPDEDDDEDENNEDPNNEVNADAR